jgi:hypothetical protein
MFPQSSSSSSSEEDSSALSRQTRSATAKAQGAGTPTPQSQPCPVIRAITEDWKCSLNQSLPPDLRPRPLQKNGKRVCLRQQDEKRLDPEQWPKVYLKALCKLALFTSGDKEFAHKILAEQVRRRQKKSMRKGKGVHPEHYARKALTSDIEAVTRKVEMLKKAGRYRPEKNVKRFCGLSGLWRGVRVGESMGGVEYSVLWEQKETSAKIEAPAASDGGRMSPV